MKKIKLLKQYFISSKGDELETSDGIAELLVSRKVAEYKIDKAAVVKKKKIKNAKRKPLK